MTPASREVVPLIDLAGGAALAREAVVRAVTAVLGPVPCTLRFHREWNGGWRCAAELALGERTARVDFVLLRVVDGVAGGVESPAALGDPVLLAVPIPVPFPWVGGQGIPATDGSRWVATAEGEITRAMT